MVVFLVAWLFILLFLPYSFMRIWWIAKLYMIDSFPVLLCSSNAHRKLIPPPYSHGCGCHCSTLMVRFPLYIFFNAGSVVMSSFVCPCVEMFFILCIVKVKFDFGGSNLHWQLSTLGV